MRLFLLFTLVAPSGCIYIDDDTHADRLDLDGDGVPWPTDCDEDDADVLTLTWYPDVDEDGYGDSDSPLDDCTQPSGYVADGGDCDDEDPDRNPSALEICNEVDDNCDDQVDNDAEPLTFYRDSDGDGYGDPELTEYGCTPSTGYVDNSEDCDDGNIETHPGAQEWCDLIDHDCDNEIWDNDAINALTWYEDADGDGYGNPDSTTTACDQNQPKGYLDNDQDCNDESLLINPDATEVCDPFDIDENCNELADDQDPELDTSTHSVYFQDDDGDGWGRDDSNRSQCNTPSGYSIQGGDCDDNNAFYNPGASEVCDSSNSDEDCDDLADDDDDNVVEKTYSTYFPDSDGDGYGDKQDVGQDSCDPTDTYIVDNNLDCDDEKAEVSPDADEVCFDEVDNNCDGTADEDTAIDAGTWYADSDGDGYGDPDSAQLACDQPSSTTTDATDCDDGDASINPLGTEIWYDGTDTDCDGWDDYDADRDGYISDDWGGDDCEDAYDDTNIDQEEICSDNRDNNCDGTSNDCGLAGNLDTSNALAHLTEESTDDDAGSVVGWLQDLDGNGSDEILVGAPKRDSNGTNAGSVYLVMGPITGDLDLSSATAEYVGENEREEAGTSLATIRDADGAGTPGVIIGGPYNETYAEDAGVAWIVAGVSSGTTDLGSSSLARLYGEDESDEAGISVASAGDVDNDGYEDLLVGGSRETAADKAGIAWLVLGPATGDIELNNEAHARLLGEASDDRAGESLSSAGDTNGDGFSDLLIGAPREDSAGENAGAAYVLLGPVTGDVDLSSADAKLEGTNSSDLAGTMVAGVGDVNNDGFDDLTVGSSSNDDAATNAGIVYLFYGPVAGPLSLDDADVQFTGETSGAAAGSAISTGGDVDGDGLGDLVMGAYGYEPTDSSNPGATYLFYGPLVLTGGTHALSSGDVVFVGDDGGYTGYAVAGGGDGNGDGYDDLLIGTLDSGAWLLAGEGL